MLNLNQDFPILRKRDITTFNIHGRSINIDTTNLDFIDDYQLEKCLDALFHDKEEDEEYTDADIQRIAEEWNIDSREDCRFTLVGDGWIDPCSEYRWSERRGEWI